MGIQEDVQKAAAHGADAGVQGSSLRPDQVGHDHVEDGGDSAEGDGPAQA